MYPHRGETSLARIVDSIRDLWEGRSYAVGQVTLTLNEATTVVEAPNCGADSKVFLFPRHANAAAELGAGTMYVSAVAGGAFTITHANSATGDRTFDWTIRG